MSEPHIVDVEPRHCALVERSAPVGALADVIPGAFEVVYKFMREAKLEPGPNVIIYSGGKDGRVALSCGVQVAAPFESQGEVACGSTPKGQALTSTHEGSYDALHESHDQLLEWARTSQVRLAPVSWEIYGKWSDEPSALRTELFHLLDV